MPQTREEALLWMVLDDTEARRYEQGITLGIGAEREPFELRVRAERSNGFSPYYTTATTVSYLYVALGYRLGGTR